MVDSGQRRRLRHLRAQPAENDHVDVGGTLEFAPVGEVARRASARYDDFGRGNGREQQLEVSGVVEVRHYYWLPSLPRNSQRARRTGGSRIGVGRGSCGFGSTDWRLAPV